MSTIRKFAATAAGLAVLALTLLLAPAASAVDDRCPASASACHYRLPSSVTSARDACYRAEADARGIPHGEAAYRAWWNSASGSARGDWTRAAQRCTDRYQVPGGKWAWNQMVFIGSD